MGEADSYHLSGSSRLTQRGSPFYSDRKSLEESEAAEVADPHLSVHLIMIRTS